MYVLQSFFLDRKGECELAGDGGAGYCQSRILFVSGIMGCLAEQVLCLFGIMGCRADQVLFALGCIVVGVCGCCLCKCRVWDRIDHTSPAHYGSLYTLYMYRLKRIINMLKVYDRF